jgi:hypothetical protein
VEINSTLHLNDKYLENLKEGKGLSRIMHYPLFVEL